MDVKRNMPARSSSEIANFGVKDPQCLYQQPKNGLRNWRKDPKIGPYRVLMRRKIAHILSVKSGHGMEQRESLATRLENGLFMEASSQETYVKWATAGKRVTKINSEPPLPSGMATPTSGQLNEESSRIQSPQIQKHVYEVECKFSKSMAATVPNEELAVSDEPMDIEPTGGNNTGDNMKKFSDSLHLKSPPTSPKVSITEIFTAEQLREHISSLRQPTDQDFSVGVKENDKNVCQLCRLDHIYLAPEPIYCSYCAAPIKDINSNVNYYSCTPKEDSHQYCFCTKCYNASKSKDISIFGMRIPKETLQKRKNDAKIVEPWVQCDTCDGWQHQVCGLYNDKSDSGDSEYKCPLCWLKEKQKGDYKPSARSAVFSAKDLPETKLSHHIEERLFRGLKQERKERAKAAGKCFDEVLGAEDLTVRVVQSTKKKVTVKKQLLDALEDKSYPSEFPYTSKLILLFQKIGGVDVCLFSMYVQEFGSDCGQPNQRCVYISYIDSVKYFRPAIGTSTGEALRTFAFHEILIGYLDFVKRRGFATCYLWACPPKMGDDYFFYCHPENQKIPKLHTLRQWYQSMLSKAANEGIVVNRTNLYDHFFSPSGEANGKITAARLPCFDGDYWSAEVEDIVNNIDKESKEKPKHKMKKAMTKTTLKAMGHTNSSNAAIKDILLMQKLGENILDHKEDFIVIRLQFVCTQCGEPILSGKRWFCNQCKNFHLCEGCHDMKPDLYSNETHTSARGEQHSLSQVLTDATLDTKDEDVELYNELFENRNSFLSFCQKNHYQFDTFRRAKHSSMTMLYHLRRLAPPTVGTGSCQIQKSTHQSSTTSHEAKSKVELQERFKMELLELLQHASRCRATKADPCSYKNCYNMRMIFGHAKVCTVKVNGGCKTCLKVWFALNLHARNCTEQDCLMPHCKDLKRAATFRIM